MDALNLLSIRAQDLAERLGDAASSADWPAARHLEELLSLCLQDLGTHLESAEAAEKLIAAERLREVQSRHGQAMQALRSARDSVRAELAGVVTGRRAADFYLESSAGWEPSRG